MIFINPDHAGHPNNVVARMTSANPFPQIYNFHSQARLTENRKDIFVLCLNASISLPAYKLRVLPVCHIRRSLTDPGDGLAI